MLIISPDIIVGRFISYNLGKLTKEIAKLILYFIHYAYTPNWHFPNYLNQLKQFFFLIKYQLMVSNSDDGTPYHQTKKSISFLYKRRVEPKSLIQS